jgi:hypothetical protein
VDPKATEHNAEVTEATIFLFEVQIPEFAETYLETFTDKTKKDMQEVESKYLCTLLHKYGTLFCVVLAHSARH